MAKRKERSEPRSRLSPTRTVANLTDDFVQQLGIPGLPDNVPQRLAEAIERRVGALLYHLREAKRRSYVGALEIRLVRDAHQAVLTACELNLPECQEYYAAFRKLVEELGYERVDAGFCKHMR